MDERVRQAILDVCDTLGVMREFAKQKVAKFSCHSIENDEMEEIYSLCNKIDIILKAVNAECLAFSELYEEMLKLMHQKRLCEISDFFDKKIIALLDAAETEISLYFEHSNKRTIKIKYVDFYPEFNPYDHWLYKVLLKRYNVIFSDTPDYLFFSCFGNSYLMYDCIRIFISNEAVYPNLNLYDYSVTYADFSVTDRLLPNKDAFEELKYKKLADSDEEAESLLKQKKYFCNFVYSNGNGDNYRRVLFEELSKYKTVFSGGSYLNNIGYKVDDICEFQSQFKFSIACENSFYRGYTTEKIINALNAKTIPIYWGNPDACSIINSKAIINCHNYPDIDSVIKEILYLDDNDEAYMRKLQEPILLKEDIIDKYIVEREQFIYNIIDQPYTEAFRRNRGLRGQWYNDFMCYILGYPNEWFSPEKNYFVKRKSIDSAEKTADYEKSFNDFTIINGCLQIESSPINQNDMYILCPYGIGDTLFVASLVKSYKQYSQEKRKVYLLVKDNHKDIPDWFEAINGKIVSTKLVCALNKYCISTQTWQLNNFIYGHFKKNIQGQLTREYHDFCTGNAISLYKKLVFNLPDQCTYERPIIRIGKNNTPYIIDKRTIIFMPYAASCAQMPNVFWEILAEIFTKCGYRVYTNVKDDKEQAIRYTESLSGDLDTTIGLCKNSLAVISLRSGICDALAFTDTMLFIINTSEYYYRMWNVSDIVDREGIINFLYTGIEDMERIVRNILYIFDIPT